MNDIFGNDLSKLKNKKLYLLDMDGTIYLGKRLFECTIPFLNYVVKKGSKYLFITNNSSKSVDAYVDKLTAIGVPNVLKSDFYTSSMATISYIKRNFINPHIYVQGTESFLYELKTAGLNITTEIDENIDIVLVGFDLELTMSKLEKTCYLLTKNKTIPYIATNPDWVCPTEWGYVPDCGSMCFGIEKATGRKPFVIGKPEKTMIEEAVSLSCCTKEETIVIGDRLYTDIASGNNANVDTICVLTGETTLNQCVASVGVERPTFIISDLSMLID